MFSFSPNVPSMLIRKTFTLFEWPYYTISLNSSHNMQETLMQAMCGILSATPPVPKQTYCVSKTGNDGNKKKNRHLYLLLQNGFKSHLELGYFSVYKIWCKNVSCCLLLVFINPRLHYFPRLNSNFVQGYFCFLFPGKRFVGEAIYALLTPLKALHVSEIRA